MIWDKEKKFDFKKANKKAFEILDKHFKKFTKTGFLITKEIENPQWIIDAMEEYQQGEQVKVTPDHCICQYDQYGGATNPKCLIHGD